MKRKAVKLIAIFILTFFNLPFYAQAVTSVKITYNGQVVDSLWGVDAIYSTASKGNVDRDTTYSCAAFLKKFCSKIWGVTIYNINVVNSKPTVTITGNHTVSLKTVSTPRPGDIMQTKNYSHVAVVKAVNGSNAVLIEQNYSTIEKESEMNTSIDEMKYKLDEMMNEIKVIRMYHILDTLKRSDYSNIKDVPSLTLKFDEDGRYGNKGDYVVKIEDVDKLTDYLSKTTNYYDKALNEVAKKTTQADKK